MVTMNATTRTAASGHLARCSPMVFENLDFATRQAMLLEFDREQAREDRWRPLILSPAGQAAFPELLRTAIELGDEIWLARSLRPEHFRRQVVRLGDGHPVVEAVDVELAAILLARTEFNTAYVSGLCRILLDQGIDACEVYRAAPDEIGSAACALAEGMVLPVPLVYAGRRRAYWPAPGDPRALTVPAHPGCAFTIRRPA